MIKTWKDRVEEAAHFSEEDYRNDVQYFMQAEIDELRAENARLKAELGDLPQAQAELLSECKRLRDALTSIEEMDARRMYESCMDCSHAACRAKKRCLEQPNSNIGKAACAALGEGK